MLSSGCDIMSTTGKLPAQWENNAHKRLKKETSGADVLLVSVRKTCLGLHVACAE